MKKIIVCTIVSIVILACNQPPKTDEYTNKRSEALALYKKNLAVLQSGLRAFENEQIDVWSSTVADNCVWNPTAYGASAGGKADWAKTLSGYIADWDSLKLKNPVYLPGLDSASFEPDGSVLYYGQWEGVHKSGMKTVVNFYGTYEFDNDNKIVSGSDFFDLGGLMNAIAAKSK